MAVVPLKIPYLTQAQPFVDEQRRLTTESLRRLNDILQSIGYTLNAILAIPEIQAQLEDLDDAIAAAQAAADNANAAADSTKAEQSLVSSFVKNPENPVSADSTGLVTIVTHDRQYGDPTLNPTVSVTGGSLATAAVANDVIRVFYDQPSRAGGTVTYQFTKDPAPYPVQGNNRHSVGVVSIPATGTQTGGGVRPPGYVEP